MIALTPKRYANGKRYSFSVGHNGLEERHGFRWRKPKWAKQWKPSFVFKLQFGPGPGYCRWSDDRSRVEQHGWGITLAWRSGSRNWQRRYSSRRNSGLGLVAWHTPFELHVSRRAHNGYYLSS